MRIRTLQVAFVVLLAVTAGRLLAGTSESGRRSLVDRGRGVRPAGTVAWLVGLVAGLMGVGGGVIVVPALVLLFEVGNVTAKGTSLLVVLPTALVGTLRNLRQRQRGSEGRVARWPERGAVLSAFGGGLLAGVIAPDDLRPDSSPACLSIIALGMARDIAAGARSCTPARSGGPESPDDGPPPAGDGSGRLG